MPHLELRFLGLFQASLDRIPLTAFESNKVRALLAYLAIESQRPHPRESLAALLWPDWPNRSAMSNLRYALSDLRKVIGDRTADPPFLLISREAIQFNTESDYALDVADFSRLADGQEIEQLERAVALYQGEFLDGFSVSDATPFEDWARLKREQLHRAYLQSLHSLAAALEGFGKYERAMAYVHRQVGVEPLDEGAWRQLMRLLAFSGRRVEALAQYEACRKVLKDELSVEPSVETARLYSQIREGKFEGTPSVIRVALPARLPASLDVPAAERRSIFVARKQELKQLGAFLSSALDGRAQVAFVTGGAGRGKSALMREFARQAMDAHPDLLAAAGNCNPYSGVGDPYLPLRSVLRTLMGNIDLAGSSGMFTQAHLYRLWQAAPQALQALVEHGFYLIDTFVPSNELLTQAEAMGVLQPALRLSVEQAANRPSRLVQEHLFEQYCALLRSISRNYPLLVLLDDLQWSDAASAALLYHLGIRLEGSRILVLCSYRPEEVVLGRAGQRHPLEKTLAEFQRRYGDVWLDLDENDKRQGRCFVETFLDSEPNRLGQGFREQLFRHTEGHALFTIELLRALQERGSLVRDADKYWIEGPTLDWEQLPARVEAVIAERVGRLDEDLHKALSIASVEGEDFTAQVVAKVQRMDERQLLHELSEQLEKRHRLVYEQGELQIARQTLSRYRFAHALYQQYLYNQLGSSERRLLHRAIAQVLEELYKERATEIVQQLAYHWQQAKDTDKAREYAILAGQAALATYANENAERYFRQALQLDPSGAQRAALLGGLGEVLRAQAKREEAVHVLRQGIDLYHQVGDSDGMAHLYHCLSQVLWRDNQLDAWNVCQEGLRLAAGALDSPGLARLLAEAGRTAYFVIDGAAEDLCRRAMEMAERLGVLEVQAQVIITMAMVITDFYGKYDEAIQMLERVIAICETQGLWYSAARAHSNLGMWLNVYYFDPRSANQHYLQGAKLGRQIGDVDLMFQCLENSIFGSINLGNLTNVKSELTDFLQQSSAPKERISQFHDVVSSELLFYRGEWAQALEYRHKKIAVLRNRQITRGIASDNLYLAGTIIDSKLFTCSGDLLEAEAALLENLKLGLFHNTVTSLVKVYCLQNRYAEARALFAELTKAPLKFRLEVEAVLAIAEKRWNEAASATLSLINLLQSLGRRWEWARALIDLGDTFAQRNQPGDLDRARDAYQQSLDMFSEMEAIGYIQVLCQRLQSIPPRGVDPASR